MAKYGSRSQVYAVGKGILDITNLLVVSKRAPKTTDHNTEGTVWVDKPNKEFYVAAGTVNGVTTWVSGGGGNGTFVSLDVSGNAEVGGTLDVTGNALFSGTLDVTGIAGFSADIQAGATIVFDAGPSIISGEDSPDTSVTAAKGSLYLRTNGTTNNDRAYINTDGSKAWSALTTAA